VKQFRHETMIWCRLLAALAAGDAYSRPMLHEALISVYSKRRYQIIMTRYAMYLLLVNLKISNDYWTVPAIISREWKLATCDHWVMLSLSYLRRKLSQVCIPFHTPYIISSVVIPMRYIKLILFHTPIFLPVNIMVMQ